MLSRRFDCEEGTPLCVLWIGTILRQTTEPDLMKTSLWKPGVLTILSGFVSTGAVANEESGQHEFPHHHLALFVGGGIEKDKNGHEESGVAFGFKYELQFQEKWGVGAAIERLSGSGTHRSWVVAIPLILNPSENWRLFAGPGFESNETKDKYLTRVGVAYEISFHQRWFASPEVLVDFIEGGATTYVLGIAVGYGF